MGLFLTLRQVSKTMPKRLATRRLSTHKLRVALPLTGRKGIRECRECGKKITFETLQEHLESYEHKRHMVVRRLREAGVDAR